MVKGLILVALLSLPLAGCARNYTLIQAGLGSWCATNKPEQPSAAQYELYSRQQKIDMADKNEFGAKHCGWKP